MAFVRLIAIAKDEAAYLSEWVHHHLHFGFDQIAIILNGCTDNSRQLLERIAQHEPRLLVRDGDGLKAVCQLNGQNFQIAAYAQELALARQNSRVTHVMCLDIDEFWVTPGLQDTIHTYTDRYPQADSIAFAWHMEVPSNPEPFSPAIQERYPIQKNRHVKSLTKISDRLIDLGIHNAIYNDGIYLVADGSNFIPNITNGATRAVLDQLQFIDQITFIDPAFIYHRLFRSQTEYLASLQRGRPNLDVQLKDNRWGYRTDSPQTPVLTISHSKLDLEKLHQGYTNFIKQCNIKTLINEAHDHTNLRANATRHAYQNPSHEVKQLTFIFAGISDLGPLHETYSAHIAHHIDSVTPTEQGCVVKGWVIDKNSEREVNIALLEPSPATITRIPRPDVVRHYPGTHVNSGFRIELAGTPPTHVDVTFICGTTTSTHTLPLSQPTA